MDVTDTAQFITYFESVRGRTERVIDVIPPDRLEWRPRDGAFSFGDLVRHIAATERYMFTENARGNPSAYPGHGAELASGPDGVRAYMRRLHAESVEILAALPPSRLLEECVTPGGAPLRVWKWLRAMIEHEVHHRGQIYLMLGLIGVAVPPLYGLTEAQVRANSRPLSM